jgi:hypothetical protein
LRRLLALGTALTSVALAACSSASESATTMSTTPISARTDTDMSTVVEDTAPNEGRRPEGFTTVTARITAADGTECEVCLWLADSPEERARGLMDVTSLGPAAGMVFVFEQPTAGAFYMFDTPTPLSIAWFGDDGVFVGDAEMEPCLDTPAGDCPLYSPGASYRFALEVFAGGLDDLGAGPGSVLALIDGTEAADCPVATPS